MDTFIRLIMSLSDCYDYEEYVRISEQAGALTLPLADFAQKVGMLQVSLRRYPSLPPLNAFKQFLIELGSQQKTAPLLSNRTCCGGGRIV